MTEFKYNDLVRVILNERGEVLLHYLWPDGDNDVLAASTPFCGVLTPSETEKLKGFGVRSYSKNDVRLMELVGHVDGYVVELIPSSASGNDELYRFARNRIRSDLDWRLGMVRNGMPDERKRAEAAIIAATLSTNSDELFPADIEYYSAQLRDAIDSIQQAQI